MIPASNCRQQQQQRQQLAAVPNVMEQIREGKTGFKATGLIRGRTICLFMTFLKFRGMSKMFGGIRLRKAVLSWIYKTGNTIKQIKHFPFDH